MLNAEQVYAKMLEVALDSLRTPATPDLFQYLQAKINDLVLSLQAQEELPNYISFKLEPDRVDPSILHILPGNSVTWAWMSDQLRVPESPQTRTFLDELENSEARNPDSLPANRSAEEAEGSLPPTLNT